MQTVCFDQTMHQGTDTNWKRVTDTNVRHKATQSRKETLGEDTETSNPARFLRPNTHPIKVDKL